MYNQPFTYHCHTNFSDGKDGIRDMVRRAKEIGFTELGISDHLIVHKNIYQDGGWKYIEQREATYIYNRDFKSILENFKKHCAEIRQVAKEEDFKVYVGFEVDYFPYNGWLEELKEFISQLDYDYLHSGNHFFCDESYEHTINMSYFTRVCDDKSLYNEYIIRHFDTLRQCVESELFDFLAHIDYLKRYFGEEYGKDKYIEEKKAVLDALQQKSVAMEISTKGLRKVNDFYPDARILDEAAKRDISFVISDDAHRVEELGADFHKAEEALKNHGITKRFKI